LNFLAHLYLSGDNHQVMVGNFMADRIRSSQMAALLTDMAVGVQLHRFIDHYTDTHPVVAQSKERLRADFGKYAPVIVDVFYDHFLAAQWEKYHNESLEEYSGHCYGVIYAHKDFLPERVRFMFGYMRRDNWLLSYRELNGIRTALRNMSMRARHTDNMHHSLALLKKNYSDFQAEFDAFFSDLKYASRQELGRLQGA
jgi:acyl carrier protein phosphodiesterase